MFKTFKTKQKMLIALLFIISLTVKYSGSAFAREVKVFYNGNEIIYDFPTEIISDYAVVPLSETLEVIYNRGTDFDPATMLSTFFVNGHAYAHTIGSNTMYIDGIANEYNRPSLIEESRVLVPTEMIEDITGLQVLWDSENYFILISESLPVIPTQDTVTQYFTGPAEVITAELSKDVIVLGETVTITINTNTPVNYVWVADGSETIPVIFSSEDVNGLKTWVLEYKASKNTSLYISASTAGQIPGVAMKHLTLTVNEPLSSQIHTDATIYSALPNTTNIEAGGSVDFTIITNSATEHVWLEYSGSISSATFDSMDAGGIKTWTAKIHLSVSQTVDIRAGTVQLSLKAAHTSQYITVDSKHATITGGPYLNPQTIYAGRLTTISVTTNSATNYVWSDIGENGKYVYFDSSDDNKGGKLWTASVTLYSSRSIRVYAGAYSDSENTSATVNAIVHEHYQH